MRHYQRRRRTGCSESGAPPASWRPRWPSESADHVTSSGVAVDVLEGGDVLVSARNSGMVALSNVQWRELAAYALAWVSDEPGSDWS